jgi:two-component system response regulator DesR
VSITSVLIIDDSPTDLMIMSALLDLCPHYEVTQASDGFAALKMLVTREADVCLVDFDMPGMTGLEFAIEARSRRPGQSCILVTGAPPSGLAAAAEKAGVHAIISKASLSPQLLDKTIQAAIGASVQ